jgi:FkbM family methyltransferase
MNLEELKKQHEPVYHEIIETNQYRVCQKDIEGKNVIDIGANNGVFTLLCKGYNAKKIVAVESNIEAFNFLKSNTKEYQDIIVINKAAADKNNEKVSVGRRIEYGPIDGRCFVIHDTKGNVDTISLYDLIRNFDGQVVLKLDAEGSEYDIIYGAPLETLKRCSTILIEMHENMGSVLGKTGLIEKLRDDLKNLGFVETWIYDYVKDVKIARYDMNIPEVTVVISEYLRPEFLLEQIECFQKQTLKPKEIIIWQTQVEGQEQAYKFENLYDNVHVIKTDHDFNLPARFAMPLLAKTPFVCLVDDDIFPGPKWLEECHKILIKNNVVVSPYGIKYNSDSFNDLSCQQYGDNGQHNESPAEVDMGGHGWYAKYEWFSLFWDEPVLDEKIADDIHFSYVLKKNNIKTFVSPYLESNKDAWGNLRPDAGMGVKSLHARKFEDEKVWKDLSKRGWDNNDFDYLKNNLNVFTKNREEVVKKYKILEHSKKEPTVVTVQPERKIPDVYVTCVVSTKDRYFSTLPACLMGIAQQTFKPKVIIILDDSTEFKPVGQTEPIYKTIFDYLLFQGIYWIHEPGRKMGQIHNHIKSIDMANKRDEELKIKTDWVWRVDDDEIPEKDVLERLVSNIQDDVGAIAGLVLPSEGACPLPSFIQNKIEDIYLGYNEQWYIHPDIKPKEVDHLYSSFIYRKSIASYDTDLSVVCHREETMLTYDMKLKGYKLILDPSARTWHFRNPTGGIRTNNIESYFIHDEQIFTQRLMQWGVKPKTYSHVVLDSGIGDHYVFKSVLNEYFEKNKGKTHIFYVCYPEVFKDVPNITLASIADAKILFGELHAHDVYKLMWDCNWKQSLTEAYRQVYHLKKIEKPKIVEKGTGNTIIISPYSQDPEHAKSYPFWKELVPLLKTLNYKIVQIGSKKKDKDGRDITEQIIESVDETCFGRSFKEIEEMIKNCRFWIGVDNFLQHLCNNMEKVVRGIVIYGESDPELFGYSYNKNILKSRKFLKPLQFSPWYEDIDRVDEHGRTIKVRVNLKNHPEYYNKPEEIFIDVKKFLSE